MYLTYISLILLLIILVAVIIQYTIARATENTSEQFINDPITISENVLNINADSGQHIIVDGSNLANIVDAIKKTNKIDKDTLGTGIKDPSVIAVIHNDSNIQLLIDPYINYYILNNTATVSDYKEGIFVCLSFKILRDKDCIWDLKNKVVAYLFMSDYLFIQALIKGYNLDINDVYIKKISYTDLKNTEKMFDYLFTYMVVDSEYMKFICGQRYYINGLKDVDIHRIKAYYPFIKENYNTVKYYYDKSKEKESDDSNKENKIDSMYISAEKSLLPIMSYAVISSVENFITRLEMPEDYLEAVKESYYTSDKKQGGNNGTGGYYGCYGNSEITGKFECDSYYNIDGTAKTYYSLWDKRCVADEECPYYKANTKYPNTRGGCIDGGFCEFPVGVKRLGYTKYSDTNLNTPLCYNCDNPEDKGNPDYVFENDFNERAKYKINTIISLLDYRSL
uniref:Uncharacterized protein n=1 Tax=viral metagenome TaxID=1070528 RepID=A0A6C0LFX7_9ZZZZ